MSCLCTTLFDLYFIEGCLTCEVDEDKPFVMMDYGTSDGDNITKILPVFVGKMLKLVS